MNELDTIKTPNGVVLNGQPTRYIPGTGKPSLVNKLCKVMEYVGAVPKTGHNKFHHYDYVTENDLTNAVRGALAQQGIMLIFGVESIAVELVEIKGAKGEVKDGYSSVILTSHLLIDGDSGEQIIFQVGGHAAKSDDKGLYSTFTGAAKYALQKTFLIASEEGDPENDHNAAFTPSDEAPPKPAPGRYRTAAEDPAVQARMAREEAEINQDAPPAEPVRQRRGGVATAAAKGRMVAEPVNPAPNDPPTYPEWCDVIKNCGEAHKGKTLGWVALHDPKALKSWQKDWQPKPTKPGGPIAPTHQALRIALDQSLEEPMKPDELKEIVALQEGA